MNAGSGHQSYLWQDGATTETISVTTTGTYWVQVTDFNNCSGSDTTLITELAPIPTGFLPGDTAICKYGSLKLVPVGNYENYNWSNGATVSSITISQPGTYSLNVRDGKGCVGTDVIVIGLKDCLQGFYAPNAFTPGKDGRNDIFRPLLFGNVVKYELTIYNRWGQRIFHTTNDQTGWDGTLAGKLQDSNTYVWTCTYQFEGEPVKFEKGIVNLIR